MNGEIFSFEMPNIALTPPVTTVDFTYAVDLLDSDEFMLGNYVINAEGLPSYITYLIEPAKIVFTIVPDGAMVAGDNFMIQIEATCNAIVFPPVSPEDVLVG